MKVSIKSFSLIACLIYSGGVAAFAAEGETLKLEVRIEHSEFLQPLDAFKVGDKFDPDLLPPNGVGTGSWFPVPDWLAGQWHKSGRIDVLSFTDLKTNMEVPSKKRVRVNYPENEVLGHQTDGHGQIWSYVPVPYVVRTMSEGNTNVNVINAFDVVDDEDKNSLTLKLLTVTLVVNKSNKIISICQRESLQTWTLLSDTKVSIHDSTKFFNREGEAIYAKKLLTYSEKCGNYCPVNFVDRSTHRPLPWQASYKLPAELSNSTHVPLDLRGSFAEFLRTRNLTSLIP